MESKKGQGSKQRSEQLERLVELSVTLNSTLNPDALLQLITGTATELLECEAASILLYDEQQPHLYFAAATGSDSRKLAEIPVPIEGSLAGTIFRTNHPIIIHQAGQDPRHYSLIADHIRFHMQTLLGVPMRVKERVVGVLEAVNKHNRVFTSQDKSILSVIASHAAIAISNARLLQTTHAALEKVKEADRLKSNFLAVALMNYGPRLASSSGMHHFYARRPKENSQSTHNTYSMQPCRCGHLWMA